MVEKKSEKDTMNSKIIENEKSTHLKTINGDCIKKNIWQRIITLEPWNV